MNRLECRPDVPGVSDRRAGVFHLFFLYLLLHTLGQFLRNEITKAISIAFNKSIPFFKDLKIFYLVYNISDKISQNDAHLVILHFIYFVSLNAFG